jgi:hypothetical protein
MAKNDPIEGRQPENGYFKTSADVQAFYKGQELKPGDTQPTGAVRAEKLEREPTPEPEKKPSFLKHTIFFLGLVVITYLYWFFGQISIGIPDEYVATIFTVLLYNWFVKNDYELPKWLKK